MKVMNKIFSLAVVMGLVWSLTGLAEGKTVNEKPLVIAEKGKSNAIIILPETAKRDAKLAKSSNWGLGNDQKKLTAHIAWQAGEDLAKYIKIMSSATVRVENTRTALSSALAEKSKPVFFIGAAAFHANPSLKRQLVKKAGNDCKLCPDAIAVVRDRNRIYLAGLTPESTYHAVAWILRQWGCRWYLPTQFGECIPTRSQLVLGNVNFIYKPPFELRTYWISWNGSYQGYNLFRVRNFFTITVPTIVAGHSLGGYTKELEQKLGVKNHFNLPLTSPETIDTVAAKIEKKFSEGKPVPLGMNDGTYSSNYPNDVKLAAGLYDKYFLQQNLTDVFMTFYNKVCEKLQKKYPNSKSRVGFLAYNNITIPPQYVKKAARNLYCLLAPIDIDPNHPMTSPIAPARREYRAILEEWAKVMEGRVVIYDYDQSMLVWRDLPNPSHYVFKDDVKLYRDAGILGFRTESRNAIATVFTNLYFRGHLMWNPDMDVEKELTNFYHNFYGPAAEPMGRYWNAIYDAWEQTLSTEHEFFVAPEVYTPELVEKLANCLSEAEKLSRNTSAVYAERMTFTRLSFEVLNGYMKMIYAANGNCNYAKAYKIGEKALKARLELAKMNPTFTTRIWFRKKRNESPTSLAWFRGEVNMYKTFAELTDGKTGTLLKKLPLKWAFRRDPYDSGLASNWAAKTADLTFWNTNKNKYKGYDRKDYPISQWERIRTDIYPQAQGILHTDGQSFSGYCYYQTTVNLSPADSKKKVHIFFPGVFGDAWLYVNGVLINYRPQKPLWWQNNYKYQFDVDLTGKLKTGGNVITLRCFNFSHVTGMFRRPLLYVAK